MLIAVLLGFAGALAAPALHRALGDATGRVLALLPAGLFVYFAQFLPAVTGGEPVVQSVPWVPAFDTDLTFVLDGLSLTFALLILGLGALIVLYAGDYLHGDPQRGRFFAYLTGFMAAMLGLVLADNLIALFVFWELTSFTSYLLIGYQHEKEESRASALQALLVTGGGGLAFLAGVFVLGAAAGSFSLAEITAGGDVVRGSALYVPVVLLVCAGAFTKSAQVPFHFWLPNAMAAPTPVSAFLHSATMVKAGVYLLARLEPALGGTALWTGLLATAGTLTMLTGAILALRQTDLKKVLAYSTVTALGTLVALIGLSFGYAIKAAVVFLVVHSLYKGTLFLVAGAIDHETGTREIPLLRGLRKAMPVTAAAALLAGLSMAGIPPLFGFIGKELVYEALLEFGTAGVVMVVAAVVANAATFVAAGIVAVRPFFGAPSETPRHAHEAPWAMWLGPVVLASAGLLLGLAPGVLAEPLMGAAVGAILAEPFEVSLYLWHGVNLPLLLSVATVALGVVGYLGWARIQAGLTRADGVLARGPEAGYGALLTGLVALARWQTRLIQHGRLSGYLVAIFGSIALLVGAAFARGGWPEGALALPAARFYEWTLALVIVASIIGVVLTRSRLAGVTMLGAAGFAVALIFLFFGAPDLAMTQLLVETLTVIVIVLVMRQVPDLQSAPREPRPRRLFHAGIAVAVGAAISSLLLAVLYYPLDRSVSDRLAALSVPEGFGRNIVNVILVDFRALDTLGEVVVLGVAALGAYTLLRLPRRKADSDTAPTSTNGYEGAMPEGAASERMPDLHEAR
ncbi:MAG: putative monovalent cation/H+ antiporter subunit A [Rubricoccaceae bacterium]